MEIEKTPLWREATEIMREGTLESRVGWTAIIHLGNAANDTLIPLQVTAINVRRDYVLGYADEATCTLELPMGKYARQVYPNRNTLQISLTKTHLKGTQLAPDLSKEIESQRYSATLIDDSRAITEGQGQESNTEYDLDIMAVVPVHFQLYTKSIEQIRLMSVGGSFRKTTVTTLIKSLLTNESKKAKVDSKIAISGVDFIPASNLDTKEHIVVTHGIKLFDLANYIQNKYGVYSSGLGCYVQNKLWYVYPLYDTTQFEKREKNITILVLPTNKCPEIERSYKQKGDSTVILVSADTNFRDDSGTQYLNDGNGVRLADANKTIEGYSTTKNNITSVSRVKNNSEYISDTRNENINHITVAGQRITANPYAVYSNLNARNGGLFKCVWENSSTEIIHPGMLAKIIYFDSNEIKEIVGVVLLANHSTVHIGDITSKRHSTNTSIHMFVNRIVNKE